MGERGPPAGMGTGGGAGQRGGEGWVERGQGRRREERVERERESGGRVYLHLVSSRSHNVVHCGNEGNRIRFHLVLDHDWQW